MRGDNTPKRLASPIAGHEHHRVEPKRSRGCDWPKEHRALIVLPSRIDRAQGASHRAARRSRGFDPIADTLRSCARLLLSYYPASIMCLNIPNELVRRRETVLKLG